MTKIIQRHDTAANWTSVNPVLAAGEMGVETDTNKFKFGDGTTAWSSLAYAAGEGGGGGSGTTITSADGATAYSKLALGDNLVVDTGELPWTNPQMSSNSQDGYILTSSSNNTSDGKSNMYKAFNKDTTTADNCWYTGSVSMPQWIMLECPKAVRVTSCTIVNENKTPVNFKSGYIQGSNDGSSFDTLYTITDRPNTTSLSETYTLDNNIYYKYLRVYCTASYGSGLSIQEIEFSGFTKDATAVPTLNVDAYTKTETDDLFNNKQDKLTAVSPITIKTEGTLLADLEVSGTIVNNGDGSYTNPISTAGRTNWVKITPSLDCIYTSDWEMIIPFKWERNSNKASQTFIGGTANTFYANIEDGNFRVWYNSSGYAATNFLPSIGIKTWMKLRYTGGVLTISFSTDGVTYSHATSHSRSVLSNKTETYFFGGEQSWQQDERGGMFTIFFNEVKVYKGGTLQFDGLPAYSDPYQTISASPATTSSLGVVQPDGTSITVSETGVISGQDVKTFTGYSDTGTLVLKSINGVLQWVAE